MSPSAAVRLRVATYNIHKGVLRERFGLRTTARIHELRARLHELDADIILLQEVQGQHQRHARRLEHWPAEPQDIFLARAPSLRQSFESAYGANAHYLHGHHGNALLSRYPILHQAQRDFSDHALEKRGVLHCVLELPVGPVHCFVVHFGLLAASRERQLEALIDWIRREVPANTPLIIGGDFNDWRNKLSPRLRDAVGVVEAFDSVRPRLAGRAAEFAREQLQDIGMSVDAAIDRPRTRVKTARTYPALVPWLRMDRIYLRGFSVTDARVMRGAAWARLSDHSPLVADLCTASLVKSSSRGA
jgi:endonuclease/exonuclease/phosphatase family metal-dependent hydrolase